MHRFLITLVSACSFAAMAATPAAANERSFVVRYADLNLESSLGQERLLNRIERAADIACFARTGPMTLTDRQGIRECKALVMRRAVADVGNAGVAHRFAARGGQSTIILASR